MMIIKVRNASSNARIIELAASGDAGPSVSFSYRIVGVARGGMQSYDMRAEVPEVMRFAPGEGKRFIFDFRNRRGPYRFDLEPGTYRFDGAYGGVWARNPPTVTVAP